MFCRAEKPRMLKNAATMSRTRDEENAGVAASVSSPLFSGRVVSARTSWVRSRVRTVRPIAA
jgi:hypothetical protein